MQNASGAETITIHNAEEGGWYLFLVRNYDEPDETEEEEDGGETEDHEKADKKLMRSGATLRVYRGYETEPIYTAQVPEGDGYYWNAFYLMGDTGQILPIDEITYEAMQ